MLVLLREFQWVCEQDNVYQTLCEHAASALLQHRTSGDSISRAEIWLEATAIFSQLTELVQIVQSVEPNFSVAHCEMILQQDEIKHQIIRDILTLMKQSTTFTATDDLFILA